ncbi:MAG: phosphoribosyltransferase [Deltaproteobacteria bacterium]|nr:phosphoribosyltransferase [Deltaproteobacteria bacterium]
MKSVDDINEIFGRITEQYETPVPIGGRCESNVYYRVEDLSDEDLNACAEYVAHRIKNVLNPQVPHLFLKLPGGYSFFAERLCAVYSEISGDDIPLEQYLESKLSNGHGEKYRGRNAVLVTDVITTARSSLEAHSKATLKGIKVLCWATLIDRTFGPGPVPVVSSFTGAPVRLLARLG